MNLDMNIQYIRSLARDLPILQNYPLDRLQSDTSLGSSSLFFNCPQGPQSGPYTNSSNKDQEYRWQVCGAKKAKEVAIRFAGGCYCLLLGCLLIYGDISGSSFKQRLRRIVGPTLLGLGFAAFLFPPYYEGDCKDTSNHPQPISVPFHGFDTVTQKLLTIPYYCNTLIAIGRANMAKRRLRGKPSGRA